MKPEAQKPEAQEAKDAKPTKPPVVFDRNAHGYWTPGAAWYLGRAQITLRKWRHSGGGPAWRVIMGRCYYERAELDAWRNSHASYRSTSEATVALTAA